MTLFRPRPPTLRSACWNPCAGRRVHFASEFVLPRDPSVALLRLAPLGDVWVWGLPGMEMSGTQSIYSFIIFQYNSRLIFLFLSFEWQRWHWLVVKLLSGRRGREKGARVEGKLEGEGPLSWWRKRSCREGEAGVRKGWSAMRDGQPSALVVPAPQNHLFWRPGDGWSSCPDQLACEWWERWAGAQACTLTQRQDMCMEMQLG